jgi:hypothetical protein
MRQWCLSSVHFSEAMRGSDHDSNLVVTCHTCNSVKGAEMCESVEEGKKIVMRKNQERRDWFETYVLKNKV